MKQQQQKEKEEEEEQLLQRLHKMLSELNYTDIEAMEELNLNYRKYWKYKAKLYKHVADIHAKHKKGKDSIIYGKSSLKERLARLGITIN